MTWLLLALAALALGAVTFGPRVAFYLRCYLRITAICASLGVYDTHRMAERAARTTSGHRTRPPERGSVWPSLRLRDGLPRRYLIVARIAVDEDRFAEFLGHVAHFTGRSWTLRRLPRSRRLELAQAAPLPEIPRHPVPLAVPPWVLPVGDSDAGPVLWDVTKAYHLLVCARTGWHKSSFALWLADYAARFPYWRVVRIDPEVDSPADQLAKLRDVEAEFARRDPLVEPSSRVLVVIDEARNAFKVPLKSNPDYETRRSFAALIDDKLIDRGGKRGIHCVALTVDPKVEAIRRRSSFDVRACGGLDPHEVPLVLDRPAPSDRKGVPGRYWWRAADGSVTDIRVHAIPYQRPARPGPAHEEAATTWTAHRPFGAIGARKWGR